MPEQSQKSQVAFAMSIDETRYRIMTAALNALFVSSEGDRYREYLKRNGLTECFIQFGKELGDHGHEFDWCKDPNCHEKKKI